MFHSAARGEADLTSSVAQVAYERIAGGAVVYVDSTGDNATDFEIQINSTNAIYLSGSDFVL